MTEPHLPQPDPDNAETPPSVTSHVISNEDLQWSPDGPQAVTGRSTRRAPLGSWRRLTALVGVVGLLGSGAFAVKQFAAPSSNTPTQAVQQFLSALGTGDAIGAIETLAPGERDLMVDTAVPLVEELKRLDIIDSKMRRGRCLVVKYNASRGCITSAGSPYSGCTGIFVCTPA